MALFGDLQPLSPTVHGDVRLQPIPGYGFAANVTEIPVHAFELQTLVSMLPLAIRFDADGPSLVAITGVRAGRNLFVGPKGGWTGLAVPEVLNTYPFAIAAGGGDSGQLCADLTSQLLSVDEGDPLFTDDGEITPTLAAYTDKLRAQAKDRAGVAKALSALDEAGVLAPWSSDIETLDPNVHYYVKFGALATLPAASQAELARREALPLAYAQAYAIANMRRLRSMAGRQRPARTGPASGGGQSGGGEPGGLDDDLVLDFG